MAEPGPDGDLPELENANVLPELVHESDLSEPDQFYNKLQEIETPKGVDELVNLPELETTNAGALGEGEGYESRDTRDQ